MQRRKRVRRIKVAQFTKVGCDHTGKVVEIYTRVGVFDKIEETFTIQQRHRPGHEIAQPIGGPNRGAQHLVEL